MLAVAIDVEEAAPQPRKASQIIGLYLKREFGIAYRDIGARGRLPLLDSVEDVPCNLCGADEAEPVAQRDKFGLPVTTVMCHVCGLMYLSPRPTAGSYRRFYDEGGTSAGVYQRRIDFTVLEPLLREYSGDESFALTREERSRLQAYLAENGIGMDCRPILPWHVRLRKALRRRRRPLGSEMGEYPLSLYEKLKHLVPRGGAVFEAGAHSGHVLYPWKTLHGCMVSGVEPMLETVRLAKKTRGIALVHGFSDDPRIPTDAYDMVLNVRTINHMLDPLGDLRHAYRCVKPDGYVFVDIPDAIEKAKRVGFERKVIEIDHPYMFTQRTLPAMVAKAGFEIVDVALAAQERSGDVFRIHVLGRKTTGDVDIPMSRYEDERSALDAVPPRPGRRPVDPGTPPRFKRRRGG